MAPCKSELVASNDIQRIQIVSEKLEKYSLTFLTLMQTHHVTPGRCALWNNAGIDFAFFRTHTGDLIGAFVQMTLLHMALLHIAYCTSHIAYWILNIAYCKLHCYTLHRSCLLFYLHWFGFNRVWGSLFNHLTPVAENMCTYLTDGLRTLFAQHLICSSKNVCTHLDKQEMDCTFCITR